MGPRTIATGTSRSRTMRSITAHCWRVLLPEERHMSGCTRFKSFSTTVATPRKCPGRKAPQSGPDTTVSSTTVEAHPEGYSALDRVAGTARPPPARFELCEIRLDRPRIAAQILVRPELQRIDEDRGDDDVPPASRALGASGSDAPHAAPPWSARSRAARPAGRAAAPRAQRGNVPQNQCHAMMSQICRAISALLPSASASPRPVGAQQHAGISRRQSPSVTSLRP
jgi:hypothetical protein